MAAADLEVALAQVCKQVPEARLKVSGVGNLAVIDAAGEFVAWIDMDDNASVNWLGVAG